MRLVYRICGFISVSFAVWCMNGGDVAGTIFWCFVMYCIRDWLIRLDGDKDG